MAVGVAVRAGPALFTEQRESDPHDRKEEMMPEAEIRQIKTRDASALLSNQRSQPSGGEANEESGFAYVEG